MAIDHIEIETSSLSSDIKSMTEKTNNVENQINEMFDSMAELDTMWDGSANEAFRNQFQIDYQTMKELIKEVRYLISCMEYAKKRYEECEDDTYALISSIRLEGS